MKLRTFSTPRTSMNRRGFIAKVAGLATMASIYTEAQGIQTPGNLRARQSDRIIGKRDAEAKPNPPRTVRYFLTPVLS